MYTLVETVPTASSAAFYARIVEENALLRRLITAAHEISELGYSVPEDVEKAIDSAEAMIFQVSQGRNVQDFQPLKDLLTEGMQIVEKLYEQGTSITGLPTAPVRADARPALR